MTQHIPKPQAILGHPRTSGLAFPPQNSSFMIALVATTILAKKVTL